MTRLSRIGALLTAVSGATVALGSACDASTDPDNGAECHAGDRIRCECDAGINGLSACNSKGRFAACECNPGTSTSSSSGAPADARADAVNPFDAAFGTFLGPCDESADCPDGGTCFAFGLKGQRCTRSCTEDGVPCEAPSPKCNPKLVCAVPD